MPAADRKPVRIAARSCCSRENTAGATAAHRYREHADRPARQVEGQRVEAQRGRAEQTADDELVDVADGEHDEACAGQRQPEAEQRARPGRGRSRSATPGRTPMNRTPEPARRPSGRWPGSSRPIPCRPARPTRSRRASSSPGRRSSCLSWRKYRCISAAGVEITPSTITLSASTPDDLGRGRRTHRGRERGRAEKAAGVDEQAGDQRDRRNRGRDLAGSPSQRTMARLTPSSLKLSTATIATNETAYAPNACGPSSRASATPMPSVLSLRDSVAGEGSEPSARDALVCARGHHITPPLPRPSALLRAWVCVASRRHGIIGRRCVLLRLGQLVEQRQDQRVGG